MTSSISDTDTGLPGQLTLSDLVAEERLADLTFVVVDLETTGGPASAAGITEIGAVKVRAGEVLGEFATLVRPESSIPAHIQALTGITNSMVRDAPSVAGAVAAFGEFAGDAVLVAHNAPYDLGFLKAACARHNLSWFPGRSLDTARLARVALQRGEVRNCKLSTLAAHFHSPVAPEHRALADARATTHVLHCLFERIGSMAVHTWPDLRAFVSRVSAEQRAKRYLADGLTTGPGVYTFVDQQGSALYIGTSRNVRSRVRTYFTAAETRARMAEMISIATKVDVIPCATSLEAQVRELRAIAVRKPRYNRRSRRAETTWWVRISDEAAPRLIAIRVAGDLIPEAAWGPFASRGAARDAAETIADATGLRSCTGTLPAAARHDTPQCLRGHLNQCAAPCMRNHNADLYETAVAATRQILSGDVRAIVERSLHRMGQLAAQERFEEAAEFRNRMTNVCAASERHHRIAALVGSGRVVAAQSDSAGGWDIHVITGGRLVAATHAPAKTDPRAAAHAAITTAEDHQPGTGLLAEATLLAGWLEQPGIRLISVEQPLWWPVAASSPLIHAAKTPRDSSTDKRGSHFGAPVGPAPGVRSMTRIAR
jgi:DNA polymerase-3 subunit epsilon